MSSDTFIDEDGEYGEPGQEYLFHPGKDPEKQEEDIFTKEEKEQDKDQNKEDKQITFNTKNREKQEENKVLYKDGEVQ